MDEISEETQRTFERLLRKHRKALLAYPNVHAVDVGFLERVAPDQVRLRVFERGVGETLACGTGACAAVAIGRHDLRLRGRRVHEYQVERRQDRYCSLQDVLECE